MEYAALNPYRSLYKSSERMGSAHILRSFLHLDKTFPIPLSISHAVDVGNLAEPIDIRTLEPIHWSFNESIHERALSIKPSVKLPHPWLMLKSVRPVNPGKGVLVIGPPPGRRNDSLLLSKLTECGLTEYDILLKAKGDVASSLSFWSSHGIRAVSAGKGCESFYERLFSILERYEYVVGCTLSSALFLAAAIGRKCKIVDDYSYTFYNTREFPQIVRFESQSARTFLRLLRSEKYADASCLAETILGNSFMAKAVDLKAELHSAINNLTCPVHFERKTSKVMKKVILKIAEKHGNTSLVYRSIYDFLKFHARTYVASKVTMNEIDAWENGINDSNFYFEYIKYIKNVTVAGYAVD